MISDEELLQRAFEVTARSHCPYSHNAVGAAAADAIGVVTVGCNVENASFPVGVCAEVVAVSALVAAGGSTVERIAVVRRDGSARARCLPCGQCRQFIYELGSDATRIITLSDDGEPEVLMLRSLLPKVFSG